MSSDERPTRAVLTTDGRVLIEQQDGSYVAVQGRTDWDRLDGCSEAALASTTDEADDSGHDPGFWDDAPIVHPRAKERITVRLDADMLDWFRRQGRGYQTRMNAVLRSYFEVQRRR